jgi:hypothetical protein
MMFLFLLTFARKLNLLSFKGLLMSFVHHPQEAKQHHHQQQQLVELLNTLGEKNAFH